MIRIRSRFFRFLLLTAALAAAVAILVGATLPPRRIALPPATDGTIAGVLHIHTNRSDGLSGPDEIAAAAAKAGRQFIVFTDHGDATRKPDPPTYRSGVLCLDGVEISTTGGHYIAIDMPAAPYPLGGEPRDVVEDVHRLGGFGIAAHPNSPKLELRWREWTAPFDAIEIVNPDTGWRRWADQAGDKLKPRSERWVAARRLASAVIDYPFRPAETVAELLDSSRDIPFRWAALAQRRRVVMLGGADAHAKLALRNTDPGESIFALPIPGYEAAFKVVSVRVRLDHPFTGTAAADAAELMHAIRSGHLHTAIDGVASPPSLEFTATNASGTASEGDELRVSGPVTLRVRTNAPSGFTTTVFDGAKAVSGDHHEPDFTVSMPDRPAAYWVAISSTGRRQDLAWLTSNAIYVRGGEPLTREPSRPPAKRSQSIFDGTSTASWRVEHDPTSAAELDTTENVGGNELRFRFSLSDQIAPAPFAALAFDTPAGIPQATRLSFTMRAESPMRVSVQLRAPIQGAESERWQRSVYVSTSDEERTVYFDELTPAGPTRTFRPPLAEVRSVLFVIDPVNTKRLTAGRFWIKKAAIQQ